MKQLELKQLEVNNARQSEVVSNNAIRTEARIQQWFSIEMTSNSIAARVSLAENLYNVVYIVKSTSLSASL